jgi:nucleotide-binding universal stress UspA family protein
MRILVPVDGSESANRAAAHAVSLVERRTDAAITLLNVQNQRTLDMSDISRITSVEADTARAEEQSKKILHDAIALCRKASAKFDARSAFGPVAETIVKIAREIEADQIVMGTRGLRSLHGAFMGSVSTKVVHLAEVPVTLVK